PPSRGDRYWKSASRLVTPAGTSRWKAYTSYLSRFHATGLPLALIFRPASMATGPLGEWLPGIHSGYSRVSLPASTGMVSCTRKIPCRVSLASTWIAMVPGYGVSCGTGTCVLRDTWAQAEPPANASDTAKARRATTWLRTGCGRANVAMGMAAPVVGSRDFFNLAPGARRARVTT